MRRLYRFKLAESPQQERQFVNDNLVSLESTLPDPMDEAVEREREAFIVLVRKWQFIKVRLWTMIKMALPSVHEFINTFPMNLSGLPR